MLRVLKFGGTSLKDTQRVLVAAQRIVDAVNRGDQVVAVVSAQGDMTDQLVAQAHFVNPKPQLRELDACMTAGEQISASLMAMAVEILGCRAVSLTGWQAGILTEDVYGDARILGLCHDRIQKELDAGNVVVVTGFQGVDSRGDITTLGRGGSDTTAVALAAFLKADLCQIYTDVDGVYDRDPRKDPSAVKYYKIGYDRMLALAQGGAQVLHDRSVEFAKKYGVKVQVLSSFRAGEGTLVTDE